VLLNLVSNAIKYNRPQGRVDVSATLGSDARLRISVGDTGVGIAPEAAAHLFERFYRVRDREGYASGTGLGWPIARRIVEVLGRRLSFETQEVAGSTFSFEVPLAPK
jgi:signal transduction histidine kinase